jgi:UDP-glucose 4-epimerase
MARLRVVVTGASGFLGGYVLQTLAAYPDIDIVPVTRRQVTGWYSVENYSQSPPGDVLIHLAQDNNREQVAKSGPQYQQKALATIAELLKKHYSCVVFASSAVLYGDKSHFPHKPTDPVQIEEVYAQLKYQCELAVLNHPSGRVVRLSNVYGLGMSQNNVISTILRQMPETGALHIMDSSPVRDFLWVEDAAQGIISLALKLYGEFVPQKIFNLGTGVGTSVGALARMALDISGQPTRPITSLNTTGRPSTLTLDFSYTTSACGWVPKTFLKDGIAKLLLK